ncbi:MAG: membrane protein insertion efficiency factor YidD [Desulfobulbaceae bacterium]|uniref:Putative membrane protein insertion efficiency factor n=1 Tax=Candidatus Desulfatifera sulfidica TaxID=2841691 RepID=A0A8J6TAD0_9BACT|nr:membrane protein insertion efficiency factor YidD [Candidatus Desulfatifera sulfidica]
MKRISLVVKAILQGMIKGYQLVISPWLPPSCRFVPTCSAYAIEALERHGVWRGTLMALWRILRCHPFCRGGHDPVR